MEKPRLTVVVFAREAAASIGDCLAALRLQKGAEDVEVLVVDASEDGTTQILESEFPWVRRLAVEPCSAPRGKARGIAAARGDLVALVDVHDRVQPGWLRLVLDTFERSDRSVQAIGGEVVHGGGPLGGYLFEYGAFTPPIRAGLTSGDLPGNNVAYRREVFDLVRPELEQFGFYKPYLHSRIRANGGVLHLVPGMTVLHHVRMSALKFAVRRFHYGRCFGGERRKYSPLGRKVLFVGLTPGVCLLLLRRHCQRAREHEENRARLFRCFPGLALVCFAWGFGEWLGTWFGTGGSCRKIY